MSKSYLEALKTVIPAAAKVLDEEEARAAEVGTLVETTHWETDCYSGKPTTNEQKAFHKYWLQHRQSLYIQLTPLQKKTLDAYMCDLYGGPFFRNSGSWGTEAEAAWQFFTEHPDQTNLCQGVNLLAEWRRQKPKY